MFSFLKKYWFLVFLAFIATALLSIKVFLPAPEIPSQPPSTPQPTTPSWNGIVPGETSTQDIERIAEKIESKEIKGETTDYIIKRNTDGPPHEVITQADTVVLVKDRILSGTIEPYQQKYGNPEGEYWGEHQKSGFKTYVWPKNGIAVVAHQTDGSIYEIWYFQPTTLPSFLSKFGKGLSIDPQQNTGY